MYSHDTKTQTDSLFAGAAKVYVVKSAVDAAACKKT